MIVLVLVECLLFGVFLAADLVSKHFVMPYLEAHGRLVVIDKVLTFTPAYNTGAGFSMLSGKTGWLIAITAVGLALIMGLTIYTHLKMDTKKKSTRFLLVVEVMMLAGGVGNLVDRIRFGWVRDFIDYTVVETLFHRSFAICNVADIWLTVGMILLIVYVLFFWRDTSKNPKEAVADAYQVDTALRLLDRCTKRTVDARQVVMREEECAGVTDAEAPLDTADTAEGAEQAEDAPSDEDEV